MSNNQGSVAQNPPAGAERVNSKDEQESAARVHRWAGIIIGIGLLFIFLEGALEYGSKVISVANGLGSHVRMSASGSYPIGLVVLLVGVALMAFAFFMSRAARPQPADEQPPRDPNAPGPLGSGITTHVSIATRKGWISSHADFARAVDMAVMEVLKISERNRTLKIVEYKPDQFLVPAGHGQSFTLIEIGAPGWSPKTKNELYQAVASKLQPKVPSKDLQIRFIEVPPEIWGGNGGESWEPPPP